MWKIFLGFVVFAALALYILQKSGGDVDLGGEKHDVAPPAATAQPAAPPASVAAAVPSPAAPLASQPAASK